jgi:uncharacterized membrane protein
MYVPVIVDMLPIVQSKGHVSLCGCCHEREADMPIILGLFQDVAQAQAAVQALLANHSALQPANIGIVSKRTDGQIGFWETAEEQELRQLSMLGRVTGWLLGLAGTVVGAPFTIWQSATVGDMVGVDLALRHDAGFPDRTLRHLGEQLHAGSAAVIILTHREESAPIVATLQQFGSTIYQEMLPPDVEAEIAAGRDADRT